MTTILWTIYWTGFVYTLTDCTLIALLPDKQREPYIKSLSVLLTSLVWPLGRVLTVYRIVKLSKADIENG